MSRRKCALLSLVVILVGTLALASPDGPLTPSAGDPPGVPDQNVDSKVGRIPVFFQRLVGLPRIEIEIESGSKTECPTCRAVKQPLTGESVAIQNALQATTSLDNFRCLSAEVAALPPLDAPPAPDTATLQLALDEMFPESHLKVVATADDAVAVVGEVECAQDIALIMELAEKFHQTVVNRIEVVGPQQVQMRMLIAEVTPGKLDGMRLNSVPGSRNAFGKVEDASELRGFLRALKQEGHAKIIAEPTLVTFTGRPASMVVGGTFPIQLPDEHGKLITEFREYGTRIECLPIVLGKNRIRLEVRPELTSLDFANGVLIRGCIIPGVRQRRIDTQIEMQSGETYIAGGISTVTKKSENQESSLVENAWLIRMVIGTCLSQLIPYAPCIPDQNLIQATRAIAEQGHEPKELIVMVTANLVEPLKLGARKEHANSAHPQPVGVPFDFEFVPAGAEMEVDQPHAPAILLTPLDRYPSGEDRSDRPRVRLSEARVSASPSPRILFGVGVNTDCGLAGNITVHESEEIGAACRDNCCEKSDRCQRGAAACCRQTVHIQTCDADECDDEDDEGDDDDDAVESFIAQVLQSQMQYLEGMMRVRLKHEKELMEAKSAAESAFAKQKVEHAEEVMKLRLAHMAEILALQETIWEGERKALADRHRDAMDHERELAELRVKHVEELQSIRIAALESEVKLLRGHASSSEPERVANAPEDVGRQSSTTRRPVLVELPIHVEELASGRVRYSPIPPKPSDEVATAQPHVGVERVELTTPPISATRPTPTEIERLRREVARLHALIEDLVCVAPEAPPSPKPQSSIDDDDD